MLSPRVKAVVEVVADQSKHRARARVIRLRLIVVIEARIRDANVETWSAEAVFVVIRFVSQVVVGS